jgi:uncharacterized membrane protein YhaH (DUF805 family)
VSWSKTYTIKKGNHSSSGIHSGLFISSELSIKVKFNNSAIYTSKLPANQWAINKLFGFSDCFSHHHTNSARFGWRYLNSKLELMAYNYVKKQRWEEKIGDLKINEWQDMKIKMDKSNYIFSFGNASFGNSTPYIILYIVVYATLFISFVVFVISLIIRRLHDMGMKGWWIIVLFFVPIGNFIIAVMLLAGPGKKDINQYGEIPTRNKFFNSIFNIKLPTTI